MSSLGGLLLVGYANQAYQGMGDSYLMPVIAAVVLGGTSILGGSGSYSGTFVGAFFISSCSPRSCRCMQVAGRRAADRLRRRSSSSCSPSPFETLAPDGSPWPRLAVPRSFQRSGGPSFSITSASAARPPSRSFPRRSASRFRRSGATSSISRSGGYLERSHGGALIQKQLQSTFEPEAAITAEFDRPEKESIGFAAAATLHSGASVIFDSSSTVLAAARACVERDIALTAVTNDLGIGQALCGVEQDPDRRPGRHRAHRVADSRRRAGEGFLSNLSADVAFIGTHAISGLALTETSLEAAAMKRAMISAARRIVLLADASKFGAAAFCKICDVSAVHELITDDRADPAEIARLARPRPLIKVVPSQRRGERGGVTTFA